MFGKKQEVEPDVSKCCFCGKEIGNNKRAICWGQRDLEGKVLKIACNDCHRKKYANCVCNIKQL